jgi:hypothetical protein
MASPDREEFSSEYDPRAIRMESELLRLENRYLKAELARRGESLRAASSREASRATVVLGREEYDALCRARYDLRWLLGRLEATFARLLLRRFGGWRTLVHSYLEK